MLMIQQNPKLSFVKPEILERKTEYRENDNIYMLPIC